jgi:hypothetical protein
MLLNDNVEHLQNIRTYVAFLLRENAPSYWVELNKEIDKLIGYYTNTRKVALERIIAEIDARIEKLKRLKTTVASAKDSGDLQNLVIEALLLDKVDNEMPDERGT